MENLTSHSASVKSLQLQAAKMVSAGPDLTALLDQEASCLKRKDEASRLIVLRSAIVEELDRARSMERAASYGHSKAKLTGSLIGLVAGIAIGTATQNKRLRAFSCDLLENLGGKGLPFGRVMVCIGPKGVPTMWQAQTEQASASAASGGVTGLSFLVEAVPSSDTRHQSGLWQIGQGRRLFTRSHL